MTACRYIVRNLDSSKLILICKLTRIRLTATWPYLLLIVFGVYFIIFIGYLGAEWDTLTDVLFALIVKEKQSFFNIFAYSIETKIISYFLYASNHKSCYDNYSFLFCNHFMDVFIMKLQNIKIQDMWLNLYNIYSLFNFVFVYSSIIH